MPHGDFQFTWFAYVFQVAQILFLLGAIWLILDSARAVRRRENQHLRQTGRRKVSLFVYQVVTAIALIFHLIVYIPALPSILAMISLFASPVLLFVFLAYLLNIVFYKRTEEEAEQLMIDKKKKRVADKAKARSAAKDTDVQDFDFGNTLTDIEEHTSHDPR